MEFFNCIALDSAQDIVKSSLTSPLTTEIICISQCRGRILAEDMVAVEDVPAFSRSTVDGYAVMSSDTFGAGEGYPVLLDIVGEVLMGQEAGRLLPGQAYAIPTGGMLPAGADAVVMLEHSDSLDDKQVLVLRAAAPGENTILRGEDVREGSILLAQGERISPEAIGVLAACGIAKVPVFRPVTIGIISTGDEIIDVHERLASGQMRDVNSYTLAALLEECGGRTIRYGIVPDNYERLLDILAQALAACDMVIISGGSSVGARDHTQRAIAALGSPGVLFHGVSVKPGKPTIFGLVGTKPVFGLPGHPAAAMMIGQVLVKSALDILLGRRSASDHRYVMAKMSRNVGSTPGRTDLVKVKLAYTDGQYQAEPIFGKSGLISTLTRADGIVVVAPDKGGIYAGEWIQVQLL